jgi:hypothetical protein
MFKANTEYEETMHSMRSCNEQFLIFLPFTRKISLERNGPSVRSVIVGSKKNERLMGTAFCASGVEKQLETVGYIWKRVKISYPDKMCI